MILTISKEICEGWFHVFLLHRVEISIFMSRLMANQNKVQMEPDVRND